jgi:hypothetical protein
MNRCCVSIFFIKIYSLGIDRLLYLYLFILNQYTLMKHIFKYILILKLISYLQPWIHVKNTCIKARFVLIFG